MVFQVGVSKRNRQGSFDIVNLQIFSNASIRYIQPAKVGYWHQSQSLVIRDDKIIWDTNLNKNSSKPMSQCSDNCPPGFYVYRDIITKPLHRPCCWSCSASINGSVFNTSNQLSCLECPLLSDPNRNRTKCIDLPILQLQLDSPVAIIIYILALVYTLTLTSIWVVMTIKRNTPVIKGSNFILVNF